MDQVNVSVNENEKNNVSLIGDIACAGKIFAPNSSSMMLWPSTLKYLKHTFYTQWSTVLHYQKQSSSKNTPERIDSDEDWLWIEVWRKGARLSSYQQCNVHYENWLERYQFSSWKVDDNLLLEDDRLVLKIGLALRADRMKFPGSWGKWSNKIKFKHLNFMNMEQFI